MPKTEEEIRIEKILDQMDLERLEHDRKTYDMEGWGEKTKRNRWTFRRPEKRLTNGLENDIVIMPQEEDEY